VTGAVIGVATAGILHGKSLVGWCSGLYLKLQSWNIIFVILL